MRNDSNPFNSPDIDFYQMSYDHALVTGRVWRFGLRKTLAANGGQLILGVETKEDKLEFRKATLSVVATGNANAITEIRYQLYKGATFDNASGTELPVYPLNFNQQYPAPENAPLYREDPTVSVQGELAAPTWYIDAPGRTIGNINEDALSIVEPNSQYLVVITNDDATDAHDVVFHATFSFPPIGG